MKQLCRVATRLFSCLEDKQLSQQQEVCVLCTCYLILVPNLKSGADYNPDKNMENNYIWFILNISTVFCNAGTFTTLERLDTRNAAY